MFHPATYSSVQIVHVRSQSYINASVTTALNDQTVISNRSFPAGSLFFPLLFHHVRHIPKMIRLNMFFKFAFNRLGCPVTRPLPATAIGFIAQTDMQVMFGWFLFHNGPPTPTTPGMFAIALFCALVIEPSELFDSITHTDFPPATATNPRTSTTIAATEVLSP